MTPNGVSSQRLATVHAVAGRVRVSIAGLRRSERLKSALERSLPGTNGIRSLSASVWTGNVLIFYEPGEDVAVVLGAIETMLDVDAPPDHGLAAPSERRGAVPIEAGLDSSVFSQFRSFIRSLMAVFLTGPARPPEEGRAVLREPVAGPPARSWHTMNAPDVALFWETPLSTGLDTAVVERRILEYGTNALPTYKGRSPWAMFGDQFKSLPVVLLLGSAVLSMATGGFGDAAVIVLVVLLNASMGFATESQAERTIAMLLDYAEPVAAVRRNGTALEIRAGEIVPGDIMILTRGLQVPADGRIVAADWLTLDESALTGESMPVEKSPMALQDESAAIADRSNMVFRGTLVTGGSGLAIAVATGRFTEIGEVRRLIAESARPETPIERQLAALSNQMVWVTLAVTGGVLAIGLLRGFTLLQMVSSAISLAVAAVPEGLPVVATTALASTVHSMLRYNVLIRRLDATEALGTTQVVCLDKTGTLTQNRMSVSWVFAGMRRYLPGGEGRLHAAVTGRAVNGSELARLLEIGALCSEAEVCSDGGTTSVQGSPTESALIEMALREEFDVEAIRRRYPLLRTEHRTENRNYMATWHAAGEDRTLLAVKGSPAEVLPLCGYYARNGRVLRMTKRQRQMIEAENSAMAAAALRVLACGCMETQRGGDSAAADLTWIGLVGMSDPPREGLATFIQSLRDAGIRPAMITGDQTPTARAVGRALGFDDCAETSAAGSQAAQALDPQDLLGRISEVEIFSRVSPADKLRIVRALQSTGAVVAMTGDGINDGPALKAADIGITFGQGGTQVAREVADVVLLDDNIQSLLPAIRDGRRIHDNIRTAIHYISATNLSEVALTFVALAAGLGQPLNPRQLLWINVLTDVFPELALAMQGAEADVMRSRPRDANARVIGARDLPRLSRQCALMTTAALGCYAYGFARYGIGAQASTVAFLGLAATQLLHAFSARSEVHTIFESGALPPNRLLRGSVFGALGALGAAQLIPGLRGLLGTTPVGVADYLVCAAASVGTLFINEMFKSAGLRDTRRSLPAPDLQQLLSAPASG